MNDTKEAWKKKLVRSQSLNSEKRLLSEADRLLDEVAAGTASVPNMWLPHFWLRNFLNPYGAGMAFTGAAIAVAIYFGSTPKQEPVSLIRDPDQLQHVELLLEFETLKHWNPSEMKKQGRDG